MASSKAVTEKAENVVEIKTIAEAINELHKAARSDAENAVKKALECGNMLMGVKAELKHGEFKQWVSDNCAFEYSTAARYMKAAKSKIDGIDFSSLSQLYGPKADGDAKERDADEATKKKPELTGTEAEVVELNNALEKMSLPVMTAEQFVAAAGDAFLSEKSSKRLQWLVDLYDILTAKASSPDA